MKLNSLATICRNHTLSFLYSIWGEKKQRRCFQLFLSLLHYLPHERGETTVDDLQNQINWRNIGCYPWNVEVGPNTTDELELRGQWEVLGLVDLNKQIKTFVTQEVYDKLLVRSLAMPLQDWLHWLNATIPWSLWWSMF